MVKSFSANSIRPVWAFIGLLMAILSLYGARTFALAEAGDASKQPAATQPKPDGQAEAKPAVTPATVVARIGDYTITREELEQRMMRELYPRDYDNSGEETKPADAETVLLKMIAEKAMMIEGREKGRLNTEQNRRLVEQFMERRLVGLVAQRYVEANEDKIAATEDEIKQKMQADPKVDRARAQAAIRRVKGTRLLDQYYAETLRKANVKKLSENFPKVVEIHQRLLTRPKKTRKVNFIQTWQTRDEVTQSEKDMVLVEFDGGKVTLDDWLGTLNDIVPPRRPRNLNTVTGVEQLLDRALRMPLLVYEGKSLGLDRDKELLKSVRDYEDARLFSDARVARQGQAKEPTAEEIKAYFDQNQKAFETGKNVKIDVIWCKDLATAKKVRAELDAGKDFESVKQEYSPDDKGKPVNTYPGSEGLFWKDLWAGEPNDVLGPLKGFHDQKIAWRVVKVLEKTPGKPREYSSNMEAQIKSTIMGEQVEALMEQYGKELLEKYSYQIHADRIKDVDPLNIP